ncbi:Methionine aminotransferase [Rhodovastum atsumiense]|uniref:Aminotransferase n=1 Tax=Rhodovastum atsumiense TaxID=504468 RepID=A0A5M6IM69_9PROT|nr:aminotransferase [Rhodovastum atsumiense]KAA5608658.1 aminotransferase [Rhodovastum atsumiense]CAH2598816.1 Methionine aminotransferase [Rhodovastum atsumiense]
MVNPVFADGRTSAFEAMSRLAIELGAINLGQGFPEALEPPELIEVAAAALHSGPHQYPPMLGLPTLRQAVAEANLRFQGIHTDWATEVLVTSGATEALASSFLGLLETGDEVIVFQPAYDSYGSMIRRAGGVPVPVRLDPPDWTLPRERIIAAITPRTRAVVINTPMNPCGKIFDDAELAFLAGLLERHDLVAICDEVYEHLTFDGRRHRSLMTLPEARGRCLRIGSAGKSFSVTGWKVGYLTAAPALLGPVARAHHYLTFTVPPALQVAVAAGLRLGDAYFDGLRTTLQERRERLASGLRAAGFTVLDCPATYFLCVDISAQAATEDDVAFCDQLLRESGVAAIPVSTFYAERDMHRLIRFCFAKRAETLNEAASRLRAWGNHRAAA